jgi:thiamine biosynthesis lipoprotein ApbE
MTTRTPAPPTVGELQRSAAEQSGWAAATWRAIGTSVQLVVADPAALPAARAEVAAVLASIDLAASRFRADSELARLNDAGGQPLVASPLFRQALRIALDAAAWTDGLVDPTVGNSLIQAGYDRTFQLVDRDGPPLTITLQRAPGWRLVELDDETGRVRVPAGVRLDLGATAKGLASDQAAEAAASAVGCGVLVSLGGDISVAGEPPASGWPVRIADKADPELPDCPGEIGQTIVLRSGGLATSGTMARRWRRGGVALHHLIDPRDGAPAHTPWVTVSVLAPTCTLANAASTAAVILGEAAPAWLRDRGLAARLVTGSGQLVQTSGWPTEARS